MQGHVRKRRTWEFIVDIGHHPVTGRRRQKSKGGFATRREAESALHEVIRYIEGGGDPTPERTALAEYLKRWLDWQRARGIRSRTLDGYEGYVRREIVPVIGGLDLTKLRPGHIRVVLAEMQQRGLSAATIAQVRSVLGSALRQAVADGLITANPAAAVKRPRVQRRELHWPTSAQLGALLEASRDTVWEVPILLAAVTGARRSEILGISWEDVDLRSGTVFIRRGVQPVRHSPDGATMVFTPLKTKRSRRIVQLPAFALERVRRHRREQLKPPLLVRGGVIRSTTQADRSPSCATVVMGSSSIRTHSRAHSSGWHARRGCIPPQGCTTCATRSPPSSAAGACTR